MTIYLEIDLRGKISKKNIAIILSAGNGSRFGSKTPKQFISLAGKNIIEYTIEQ